MSDHARDYFVHNSAEVDPRAKIGQGTKIWNQVQVCADAVIGQNCNIGKDVYVDKGVVIGNRVKIQNGVSIYRGVVLEDDVFVGPHSAFTNDIRPRSFNTDWTVVPTVLRRGCSIGANATVMCGITLGEYSMISAGAVITTDTLPYGLYVGNPARLKGFISKHGYEMSLDSVEDSVATYRCKQSQEVLRISFEVRDQ